MNTIILIIIAGILGTAGMTLTMWLITQTRFANADMVRAVGSVLTRSYDNALIPGATVHFTVGIIIAFVYALFLSIFYFNSAASSAGLGALLGTMHGLAVSFVLVNLVAEHHPLERFRKAGVEVVVAHMVGHIVYGLVVGAVIGATGARLFTLR